MKWPDPSAPKPSWIRWMETGSNPNDDLIAEREFPDPMRTDDAAAYLGIHRSTVNRLVNRGELVAAVSSNKRGEQRWFNRTDLDNYKSRIE
jgi:excisionase family DNA binding protein